MKPKTLSLVLFVALALCAGAAIAAPYSVDLTYSATNTIGNFTMDKPVQPTGIRVWGVLPLNVEGQTVTVTRVHGDWTETLGTIALGSNVASGALGLTNAPWLVKDDVLRISGPTNLTFELQGEQ